MKRAILKNWMAAVLLTGACCGLVACDDNDGENTPPATPDITAVQGEHSGTMRPIEMSPVQTGEEETVGTKIDATVSGDKILFSDFPIRDLVVKIVGEESADAIVEKVGKISYSLPYTALMSKDNAAVKLTLAPEPLKLTLSTSEPAPEEGEPVSLEVEVTISALTEGAYTIASNKLGFTLTVDSIALNGELMNNIKAFSLEFDLAKK